MSLQKEFDKVAANLWDVHGESLYNDVECIMQYIYMIRDDFDEGDEIGWMIGLHEIFDCSSDQNQCLIDINKAIEYCSESTEYFSNFKEIAQLIISQS